MKVNRQSVTDSAGYSYIICIEQYYHMEHPTYTIPYKAFLLFSVCLSPYLFPLYSNTDRSGWFKKQFSFVAPCWLSGKFFQNAGSEAVTCFCPRRRCCRTRRWTMSTLWPCCVVLEPTSDPAGRKVRHLACKWQRLHNLDALPAPARPCRENMLFHIWRCFSVCT